MESYVRARLLMLCRSYKKVDRSPKAGAMAVGVG